jgi:ABC-type transporter Mla subunit MlaD
MYFCVTGAEAKMNINPLDTTGADFNTTCATITKRYTDLSNNLTNLLKIQSGMQDGSAKLSAASSSLTSIYNKIGCSAATGSKATLCNQIQTAASYVGNNSSDVSTTLDKVIPSLQTALDKRSDLLGFKTKFQCP